MRIYIAAALALVSSAASAQSVYKCGNTYSQTPCAADSKELSIVDSGKSTTADTDWPVELTRRIAYPDKPSSNSKIERLYKAAQKEISDFGALTPPPAARVDANKTLCLEHAKRGLFDPMSAQITPVIRSEAAEVTTDTGNTKYLAVVAYTTTVNAKNRYGAYVGAKHFVCYFDLKEDRLLTTYSMR